MKTKLMRFICIFLSAVFLMDSLSDRTFFLYWNTLHAHAAASDYEVRFFWDTSGLGEQGDNREYSLSADGTSLYLKEMKDEPVTLKTTFYFNLERAVEPGNLTFTIEGLDQLIRDGKLIMNLEDPNLVGTWDYSRDKDKDSYTFVNNSRVTSNNESTFTWQFESREAINEALLLLNTQVKVTEVTSVTDPETGEVTEVKNEIKLDSAPLQLSYESVHDENECKIVCRNVDETDFNNLNTDYDWRSYYSMVGLKGMTERTKNNGEPYVGENQAYDAHSVTQSIEAQEASQKARGIETADYFIEIDRGIFDEDDIMIVDVNGNRVKTVGYYNVNGEQLYGFYVFRGQGDREPGQSYGADYRIGVLNDKIPEGETGADIKLTGHYLITYQDEQTVTDITDTAAHTLLKDEKLPIGEGGGTILKYNEYEINYPVTYNGHYYHSHSKHYSGVNQLLFDTIFTGKTVTYRLYATAPQITDADIAVGYDLIYEDGAPTISHLKNAETGVISDRVLGAEEYDFTRIQINKLVDGNTVGPGLTENGFDYVVYGRGAADTGWTELGTGNTLTQTEVFFPAGIDEVRLVVRDLKIRADIIAFVDIAYTVDPDEYDNIYIDTENLYENGDTVSGQVYETTNQGTKLVNTFRRRQYVGHYDITQADGYTYQTDTSQHSNTWLRDSVTILSSKASISEFLYHDTTADGGTRYYTTEISAGGTIQSDTQKALKKFAVYSQIPAGVTPTSDWLNEFRDTLTFSGTLLGAGTTVDESYVLQNGLVSVRYDQGLGCIVTEFDFSGSPLDAGALTSINYSYPAQISLNRVNALRENNETMWFETDSFVTVLDQNVRVAAQNGQSIVQGSDPKNPADTDASKFAAKEKITALGSQKNNYTTKYVASSYSDWIFDNSTEVDGSNAEHYDPRNHRLTSDYTYKLVFHRFTSDTGEIIHNPVMIDIVEGLRDSAWYGKAKSVTFDENSYPAGAEDGYVPEVYYLLHDDVTESSGTAYQYQNDTVDTAISRFTMYGDNPATAGHDYGEELALFDDMERVISEQWHFAPNGVIEQEGVYAVAVIYRGQHTVGQTGETELTAYLNMSAPALVNQGTETNNNRVNYNDTHVFAKGERSDMEDSQFPMYSRSNTTKVTLRHTINLLKVSASDHSKRLSGAAFNIYGGNPLGAVSDDSNLVYYYENYASAATPMKDLPVDLSGVLELRLSPGIYYYQETTAPHGYEPDDTLYRFRATSDEDAVYYYTNRLIPESALSDSYLVVNRQEYDAYRSIYDEKTFISDSKLFRVYDSDGNLVDHFGYDADNNQYLYDLAYNGSTVTCRNGFIRIAGLHAGTYHIGTSANDPYQYTFSVADLSSVSLMIFRPTLMTDVTYELREQLGDQPASDDIPVTFTSGAAGSYAYSETGTVLEILPNPSTGKIEITGLDSSKTYYFISTSAPEGYKLVRSQPCRTETASIITDDGRINVYSAEHLEKTKELVVEDDPILKAKAKFRKTDGTENSEYYQMPLNGAVYRLYYIEEDGSEALCYFRQNTSTKVYRLMGTAGATGYVSELVTGAVGGEEGMIELSELPYGTYILEETEAPTGYQLNPVRKSFSVMASTIDGNNYVQFSADEGTSDTMQLEDEELLSKIVLSKADADNPDNYLKNAAYDIYRLKPNPDPELSDAEYLSIAEQASVNSLGKTGTAPFTIYWEALYPDEHIYTNENGTVTVSSLPFGTYLLYEFNAPKGYKWNNDIGKWETWAYLDETHTADSQIIVINRDTITRNSTPNLVETTDAEGHEPNSDGWTPTYVTVTTYHSFYAKHVDERKDGEARLIKRNEAQVGLTDAVFALYQVNLTESEINAVLIANGFREEAVAAMSAAEKQRELSKIELTVSDITPSLHFADGRPVTSGGGTVDTAISQNLKTNGDPTMPGATVTSGGLSWGVYYYYEVKAPSGYEADPTAHFFAVNSESVGSLIEVEATDAKTYGKIWLYKQAKDASGENRDEHIKLFGAQFALYTGEDVPVLAVPMLRLSGQTVSGGLDKTVNLLVSGFTVVDAHTLRFTIYGGGSVTAEYDESDAGNILSVTADDTFKAAHDLNPDTDSFRLTYYALSADGTKVYDDGLKLYRKITLEEAGCVTASYVTADQGGQLCVRGLDWQSYYFRETVPPAGYGLADDVVFSVNAYNCDNQFLKCEDPTATAAIIIDKAIPDAAYFKAYGDPTFLFRVHALEPISEEELASGRTPDYTKNGVSYKKTGRVYTLSVHLADPNTEGSAMVDVPVGQYLIEELPVSRYECVGLELVEGTNGALDKFRSAGLTTPTSYLISSDTGKYDINTAGAWTAFCDLSGGDPTLPETVAFHVRYTNQIRRYDNFSQVAYADNRIPEYEYITAFKPDYKQLVPLYNGPDSTYTYEINLAEALVNGDFEAVLSYNTGKTEPLTAADLDRISFKSTVDNVSAITNVTYENGILRITANDPATFAGQTISFDVGYGSSTYDEGNTGMVKGSLNLTFSDVQASPVKKVIFKSDAANRSYFYETDGTTKDSSVAVLFRRTDGTPAVYEKTMQNPLQTDTLTTDNSYKFQFWYLLDADGKPVTDKTGELIAFTDAEVKAYIFDGTWPAYLTQGGADLLPDTLANPADVANVSSFTFQAEVKFQDKPTAMLKFNNEPVTYQSDGGILNTGGRSFRTALNSMIGNSSRLIAFKREYDYDKAEQLYAAAASNRKAILSPVEGDANYDSNFPDPVYAYAIGDNTNGYTIYWFSESDRVYLEGDYTEMFGWSFRNYLTDVSGIYDFDFSGVTSLSTMFYGDTLLTEVRFNTTFENLKYLYNPNLTNSERAGAFANCSGLVSIINDMDNNYASLENLSNAFSGCSSLTRNDLLNGINLDTMQSMYNMMSDNTSFTKESFGAVFSTWQIGESTFFDAVNLNTNRILNWRMSSYNNSTFTNDGNTYGFGSDIARNGNDQCLRKK